MCDRVGILKDGKLIAGLQIVGQRTNEVDIEIQGNYNELIEVLALCNIRSLNIHQLNLEEIFMHFYGAEEAH